MRATSVERRRGGNCGNLLEVIAQFEHTRPYLIAPLADDENLSFIEHDLEERCGISTSGCVIRSRGQTPSAYVIISKDTNARSIISNSDTLAGLSVGDFGARYDKLIKLETTLEHASHWVHFEGRWPQATIEMMHHVVCNGAFISVELENPTRESCEILEAEADVVFYSKAYAIHHGATNANEFLEHRAQQLYYGPKSNRRGHYLFCTWGEEPAAVFDRASMACFTQRPVKVTAVDTNGAGDCFCAAAIYAMAKFQRDEKVIDIKSVLKFAVDLASVLR